MNSVAANEVIRHTSKVGQTADDNAAKALLIKALQPI
jgi:hypothetical protein